MYNDPLKEHYTHMDDEQVKQIKVSVWMSSFVKIVLLAALFSWLQTDLKAHNDMRGQQRLDAINEIVTNQCSPR